MLKIDLSVPDGFWPEGVSGAVCLTFDDGLQTQLDNALPCLDDNGLKGTFYLNPRSGRRLGPTDSGLAAGKPDRTRDRQSHLAASLLLQLRFSFGRLLSGEPHPFRHREDDR